tara:strand:+ start:1696 stop:1881 length:186 start_codon:yes stop_codon:yes gene_type:complete
MYELIAKTTFEQRAAHQLSCHFKIRTFPKPGPVEALTQKKLFRSSAAQQQGLGGSNVSQLG